jgi:chromosome segregation ATPase
MPQALEEFQEAQQRYDFLNTQRQDLIDSIRDTEKAIQELDHESRRRFKEAFDASMCTSGRCSRRCSAAARAKCA